MKYLSIIEGSLEVKLPTIWTNEKQRWEESEKRREEKKKEDQKRESLRRKKTQVSAKVGKSRNTVFLHVFPMICGSGGSKSRLVKAAGAEPAGQMREEKLHAVVARSTCQSQNVESTPAPDHFWKLRCRKRARRFGAKHISKSKCRKHTSFGPLLEVEMSKKCTFWRSDVVSRGRRTGLCIWSEMSKTWGFCSISKNDGRRGTFEEDLQRCMSRATRSTRDMFIRDVERGCILEHQIFRFAEVILRDRCSTSYDPVSLFAAGAVV